MTWTKLGRVYGAAGERPWQASHAYCPTPLALGDGRVRVYCAFLDRDGVGRVGWVDVRDDDPTQVVAVSADPVLDVGAPGAFDDNGVVPLSVLRLDDGTVRLYYAGFQLGVKVRYTIYTGLAESRDGGARFERVSRAPVLDRADEGLFVRSGAHVQPAAGGSGFRMWYLAGSEWRGAGDAPAKPVYDLRYAESPDGVAWPSEGRVVLRPADDDEHGFTRACVLRATGGYRIWYSLRRLSNGYRFGYAESADGIEWRRRDELAGIDVGPSGWDSEMVGLGALHRAADGRLYLFYNGNNHGETGFGVAVAAGL